MPSSIEQVHRLAALIAVERQAWQDVADRPAGERGAQLDAMFAARGQTDDALAALAVQLGALSVVSDGVSA